MHELALAQELVAMAAEHAARAGARHVTRLHCRIGAMRQIEPELIEEAFEVARNGTMCQGARLCIEKVPMTARCGTCQRTYAVEDWNWNCPECGAEGEPLEGGDELELAYIEAENDP